MLRNSREAIEAAQKNPFDQDLISKAESVIKKEIARAPFASLIHILSDFAQKPVYLCGMSRAALEGNLRAAVEEYNAKREQAKKPRVTYEQIVAIFGEAVLFREYQGVIVEKPEYITITVYSLDTDWLARKSDSWALTNADLVHAAVAHEVMGFLLNIDPHRTGEAVETNINAERRTQQLAARQYLPHVIGHRTYHHVPRFYCAAEHREQVLSMLFQAAHLRNGSAEELEFKKAIAVTLDEEARENEHNALRACPLVWGNLRCHVKKGKRGNPDPPPQVMLTCEYYEQCEWRERY